MTDGDNYILSVRLTPNAAQDRIHGWTSCETGEDILKISVTAIAEKGKANKALVNLLARNLRIPKSAITIVKGTKDRNKILVLKNINKGDLDKIS